MSVLVFTNEVVTNTIYTVPKIIDFPRYNKKNVARKTLYYFGIFRVVSRFPLHFVLYLGNVDYFLDRMYRDLLLKITTQPLRKGIMNICTARKLKTPCDSNTRGRDGI